MAQIIKLRRSSTQGAAPTTSQLNLGEIAINTYDGKLYFEKNDGSETIQSIVTTGGSVTNPITGSIFVSGSIVIEGELSGSGDTTASFGFYTGSVFSGSFIGDGSGITDLDLSQGIFSTTGIRFDTAGTHDFFVRPSSSQQWTERHHIYAIEKVLGTRNDDGTPSGDSIDDVFAMVSGSQRLWNKTLHNPLIYYPRLIPQFSETTGKLRFQTHDCYNLIITQTGSTN